MPFPDFKIQVYKGADTAMFQNKVAVTGENICIDGGQTRLMIYHGGNG